MTGEWIATSVLADLEHVERRTVTKAFDGAVHGKPVIWHGMSLSWRWALGNQGGGRKGRIIEVAVQSLSAPLQLALNTRQTPVQTALKHGLEYQRQRDFWRVLLAPIAAHPKHSRERGLAIKGATGRDWLMPDGTIRRISERDIRRKLIRFESGHLSRKKRSDAGQAIVIVSREFDKAAVAAGIPENELHAIADKLLNHIRSLIASGTSRKLTQIIADSRLNDMARDYGLEDAIPFTVPEHLIQRQADYRKVARYDKDRKVHEDAKPRIARTIHGLLPMDIVVADVHPVDIQYTREDGSLATPRLIGWECVNTHRIFASVVFCEAGQGITNAHVIESLLDMLTQWGVPKQFYLDNGSEYNWADAVEPALMLLAESGGQANDSHYGLTRAKPYSAQSKPIEGIFGVLERSYFSAVPGWIAGDRMRKKSANVGKPPAPFPGSADALRTVIQGLIATYNSAPQRGQLKGKSPNQAYQEAIDAGWAMTAVNTDAFQMAFSERELREVRQGAVSVNGKKWTCPELQSYTGSKVEVLIPKYQHWQRLPIKTPDGKSVIGFASPDIPYGYNDPEGAREAERRSRRSKAGIDQLRSNITKVNPLQELANVVHLLPAPRAPVGSVLGMSDEAADLHAGIRETSRDKKWREDEAITRRQDALMAALDKIKTKRLP